MTTTLSPAAHFRPGELLPWRFSVLVRREKNGPELTRVEVADSDLSDALAEMWRDGCLRRGLPEQRYEDAEFEMRPRFAAGAGKDCDGFALVCLNSRGESIERSYSVDAFDHLAATVAQELIAKGVLDKTTYVYDVRAVKRSPALASSAVPSSNGLSLSATFKTKPLTYLERPLAPLVSRATPIGEISADAFPVFYTQAAFAKTERLARQGAAANPPIETGAVLIGVLCSCPESGEFYVVVCDALEVLDAAEAQFSLSYSSKTWSRIQAIVRAKQSQPATRAFRLLGQGHGHNFLPAGGAPPCELCAKAAVCSRSSVFVSSDDRLWTRAVFAHQPWHLCHIFGLTARQDKVHALYTLQENSLVERGFYMIPEFSFNTEPTATTV
jgi:hypothetical protein